MNKIIVSALTGFMFSVKFGATASPAQCEVKYTRTACAGQEAVSYKKCGGNQSYVKTKKKAVTLDACRAAATKSCRNRRLNITKNKVITALFDGKSITTASGKANFCQEYPKRDAEFNHCGAK